MTEQIIPAEPLTVRSGTGAPPEYRLGRKPDGTMVLQVGHHWRDVEPRTGLPSAFGIEWETLPTVELP